SGNQNVAVLKGNGDGTFTTLNSGTGNGDAGIAVGDFNKDGKLDVVAAANNGIAVMLGNGTGGFSTTTYSAGTTPYAVAVGDFNGDGNLDVAPANETSNDVTVLLGNGTGGFSAAPGSPFSAGSGPDALAVGDFNGDGNLDLAVAIGNSLNVALLPGDGTGRFPSTMNVQALANPSGLAIGDFNGDGVPDIATVGLLANPSLAVLLNESATQTAVTSSAGAST